MALTTVRSEQIETGTQIGDVIKFVDVSSNPALPAVDGSLVLNLSAGSIAGEPGTTFAALAGPAFTGDPTAPTPTAGDNDTSIATTAFVQGEIADAVPAAGYSVNLATDGSPPSRAISGGPYTNSSGRPLTVLASLTGVATTASAFDVDGTTVSSFAVGASTVDVTHTVIVPDSSTFQLTGGGTLSAWFEVQ